MKAEAFGGGFEHRPVAAGESHRLIDVVIDNFERADGRAEAALRNIETYLRALT